MTTNNILTRTSKTCGNGLQLATDQARKDSDLSTSGPSDKGRTLQPWRKIRFSARRALHMFSQTFDHRSGPRSGSEGDVSCIRAQAPDDCSARSPAGTNRYSSNSLKILHAVSLPFQKRSTDLTADSQRLDDIRSSGSNLTVVPSPPAPSPQQITNQPQPKPQQPSPSVQPTLKPRSLLSALMKRQPASTAAKNEVAETDSAPAVSLSQSQKLSGHTSPNPTPSLQDFTSEPARMSPSHGHLRAPVPSTDLQQACYLRRMYDSLPAQRDRRDPDPYPLLVPQRPGRGSSTERLDLCLSAPSPNMASLKRVLLACDQDESNPVAAAPAMMLMPTRLPLQPSSRPEAPSSTSTASPSLSPGIQLVKPQACGSGSLQSSPFATPSGDPGAGQRELSSSVPATSPLASSLVCDSIGSSQAMAMGTRLLAGQLHNTSTQPPPVQLMAASGAGPSTLLAMSCSVPPMMLRSHWALEDYSLQKRLYKGTMSSVYKGRCLRSGLPVALKVYFKERVPANVIHMVMREVSIHLQSSEHKNVIKLYGVFQNKDVVVLVMELASRGSLATICQSVNGGRLGEAQVRQTILEPLLDALSYMHGRGFCHRDIKPENLLFTSDWGIRLADFGVSINLLEERAVTRAGTADYMAPEVERCPLKSHPDENKQDVSLAYTAAADVWSVGVLVYELLVGFPPAIMGNSSSANSLTFPASVSPGARDFITCALAQLPEERPTVRQLRCHPWKLGVSRHQPAAES